MGKTLGMFPVINNETLSVIRGLYCYEFARPHRFSLEHPEALLSLKKTHRSEWTRIPERAPMGET